MRADFKKEMIKLAGFAKIEELADSAVCDNGKVWTCLTMRGNKVYLQVNSARGGTEVDTGELQTIENMFGFNNGKTLLGIDTVLYELGTTDLELGEYVDFVYCATDKGFVLDSLETHEWGILYFFRRNEGATMTIAEDGIKFLITCR